MALRPRRRMWNSGRNSVTLLLLGLIGVQLAAVSGMSQLPANMPFGLLLTLQIIGCLNLCLGALLVVGGVQRRDVREWVAGFNEMMISGPFRYVRRPVYGGMLLMLFGAGLLLNMVGLLLTSFLWAVTVSIYCRVEDRRVMERMGPAYQKYCRCVPLLIPHPGRVIVDFFSEGD
jgi:protein-S-isoprenylcysteine O-methyltransferase Ste14